MKRIVRYVSIKDKQEQIVSLGSDTVDELYEFGTLLLAEVQGRSAALDSKLTSILGWSSALLGFLLVGAPGGFLGDLLLLVAAGLALGAVISSSAGLRIVIWMTPSEQDWFRDGLMDSPERLRSYHVISMLNSHQDHEREMGKKAAHLVRSEKLLVATAVLIAVALFWTRWISPFDVIRR